VYTVSLGFTA
jgi:hypothetical protein